MHGLVTLLDNPGVFTGGPDVWVGTLSSFGVALLFVVGLLLSAFCGCALFVPSLSRQQKPIVKIAFGVAVIVGLLITTVGIAIVHGQTDQYSTSVTKYRASVSSWLSATYGVEVSDGADLIASDDAPRELAVNIDGHPDLIKLAVGPHDQLVAFASDNTPLPTAAERRGTPVK